MDEVRVLDIKESAAVGRWVLATIGGYDDSLSYELTFVPNLDATEWKAICACLPSMYRIGQLNAVDGALLGRARALQAIIL